MKNKRFVFLPAVLVAVLLFGITALASPPWIVRECGVCGEIKENGEHLWHAQANHEAEYSEYGQFKKEQCTIAYNEDKEWLFCPNGHGTIWKGRHYTEKHSNSHCTSLDYYITE